MQLCTDKIIFLNDHVTLKTGVMLCITVINLHFKVNSNRKQLFEMVIIFHNITVFTVFWIK